MRIRKRPRPPFPAPSQIQSRCPPWGEIGWDSGKVNVAHVHRKRGPHGDASGNRPFLPLPRQSLWTLLKSFAERAFAITSAHPTMRGGMQCGEIPVND